MADSRQLYQEVILDHNRKPRNFHAMPEASCAADGKNPNCGDQLTVWLKVEDEVVTDVSFQGQGCAISKASASMMTDAIKGKTRSAVVALYEKVHKLVTGEDPALAVAAARRLQRRRQGLLRLVREPVRQ